MTDKWFLEQAWDSVSSGIDTGIDLVGDVINHTIFNTDDDLWVSDWDAYQSDMKQLNSMNESEKQQKMLEMHDSWIVDWTKHNEEVSKQLANQPDYLQASTQFFEDTMKSISSAKNGNFNVVDSLGWVEMDKVSRGVNEIKSEYEDYMDNISRIDNEEKRKQYESMLNEWRESQIHLTTEWAKWIAQWKDSNTALQDAYTNNASIFESVKSIDNELRGWMIAEQLADWFWDTIDSIKNWSPFRFFDNMLRTVVNWVETVAYWIQENVARPILTMWGETVDSKYLTTSELAHIDDGLIGKTMYLMPELTTLAIWLLTPNAEIKAVEGASRTSQILKNVFANWIEDIVKWDPISQAMMAQWVDEDTMATNFWWNQAFNIPLAVMASRNLNKAVDAIKETYKLPENGFKDFWMTQAELEAMSKWNIEQVQALQVRRALNWNEDVIVDTANVHPDLQAKLEESYKVVKQTIDDVVSNKAPSPDVMRIFGYGVMDDWSAEQVKAINSNAKAYSYIASWLERGDAKMLSTYNGVIVSNILENTSKKNKQSVIDSMKQVIDNYVSTKMDNSYITAADIVKSNLQGIRVAMPADAAVTKARSEILSHLVATNTAELPVNTRINWVWNKNDDGTFTNVRSWKTVTSATMTDIMNSVATKKLEADSIISTKIPDEGYKALSEATKWMVIDADTYIAFAKRMIDSKFNNVTVEDYAVIKALLWSKSKALKIWKKTGTRYTVKWGILDVGGIDTNMLATKISNMARQMSLREFADTLNDAVEWVMATTDTKSAIKTAKWKVEQVPDAIKQEVTNAIDGIDVAISQAKKTNTDISIEYVTKTFGITPVNADRLMQNVDELETLGVSRWDMSVDTMQKKLFDNVFSWWKSIDSTIYKNQPEKWLVSYVTFWKVEPEYKKLLDDSIKWMDESELRYMKHAEIEHAWHIGIDKWIARWNEFLNNIDLTKYYFVSPDSHGKPIWKKVTGVNQRLPIGDVSIHIPVIATVDNWNIRIIRANDYFTPTGVPFGRMQEKTNFKWKHVVSEIKFATRDVLNNVTALRWNIDIEGLLVKWKSNDVFKSFAKKAFDKYNGTVRITDAVDWKGWMQMMASDGKSEIELFGNMDFGVFWHEFGHYVEALLPDNVHFHLNEMYEKYYTNEFENFSEFFAEYYSQAFVRMETKLTAYPQSIQVLADVANYLRALVSWVIKSIYEVVSGKEAGTITDEYAKRVFDSMVRDTALSENFEATSWLIAKLGRINSSNTITSINSLVALSKKIIENDKLNKIITANKDVADVMINSLIRIATKSRTPDYVYAGKLAEALESASPETHKAIAESLRKGEIGLDLFKVIFEEAYSNVELAPKNFDEFYLQYQSTISKAKPKTDNRTFGKIQSFVEQAYAYMKTNKLSDFKRNVKILTRDALSALNGWLITNDEAEYLFSTIKLLIDDYSKLKWVVDWHVAKLVNYRHLFENENVLFSNKNLSGYQAQKAKNYLNYLMNSKVVKHNNANVVNPDERMDALVEQFTETFNIKARDSRTAMEKMWLETIADINKWIKILWETRDAVITLANKKELSDSQRILLAKFKEAFPEWRGQVFDTLKNAMMELQKTKDNMQKDVFSSGYSFYSYWDNSVFAQPGISSYWSETWIHASLDNLSRHVFPDFNQWSKSVLDLESTFQKVMSTNWLDYNAKDLMITWKELRYKLSLLGRGGNVARVMLGKMWIDDIVIPVRNIVLRDWFNARWVENIDTQAITEVVKKILFTAADGNESKAIKLVDKWNKLVTESTFVADDLIQNINRTRMPTNILADYLGLSGVQRKKFFDEMESNTWYTNYIANMIQTYVKWNWMYDTMQMLPRIDSVKVVDMTRNSEDALAKEEWRAVRDKLERQFEWMEWDYEEHIKSKFNKLMDIGDYTPSEATQRWFDADWNEIDMLEKWISEFSLNDFNKYFLREFIRIVDETEVTLQISPVFTNNIHKKPINGVPFNWSLFTWEIKKRNPKAFSMSWLGTIDKVTQSTYMNDFAFDLKQAFTSSADWQDYMQFLRQNWIDMRVELNTNMVDGKHLERVNKLSEAVTKQLYSGKMPPAKYIEYIADRLNLVNRWWDSSKLAPKVDTIIDKPDVVWMFDVIFSTKNGDVAKIQYTSRNWYQAPWIEKMVNTLPEGSWKKRGELDSLISIVSWNEFYSKYFSGAYKYSYQWKLIKETQMKSDKAYGYWLGLESRANTLAYRWEDVTNLSQAADAYKWGWIALQHRIETLYNDEVNPEFNFWLDSFSTKLNESKLWYTRYRDTAYTRLLQGKGIYEKSRITEDFDEWFTCAFWWDD